MSERERERESAIVRETAVRGARGVQCARVQACAVHWSASVRKLHRRYIGECASKIVI